MDMQVKVDLEKLQQLSESDAQFSPLLAKIHNELKAHFQECVLIFSFIEVVSRLSDIRI